MHQYESSSSNQLIHFLDEFCVLDVLVNNPEAIYGEQRYKIESNV